MTRPPLIRIFFAIDLTLDAKNEMKQLIDQLKKASKSRGIRWMRPEMLHITLQFLGEVPLQAISDIVAKVSRQIQGVIMPTELTPGGLHIFPDPHRPRTIVLDMSQSAILSELAALIGKGIQLSGHEIEVKPYRAHLTLARIKQTKMEDLSFVTDCELPVLSPIRLDEVVLFRSEPQPEGSNYVPLAKISLS